MENIYIYRAHAKGSQQIDIFHILIHFQSLLCSGASRRFLLFLLVRPYDVHIFPDAARIVLRTRDNRIALIVESTAENFIFVTFARVCTEALDFITGLGRPDSASLVATRRDDLVSLRVK